MHNVYRSIIINNHVIERLNITIREFGNYGVNDELPLATAFFVLEGGRCTCEKGICRRP